MGIELGRAEIRVTEHLLDAAEVGAPFQQMRGERVAQDVRVDTCGIEPGLAGNASEDEERAGPCQGSALGVEEELGPSPAVEIWAAAGEVAAHGLGGLPAERNDALLVSLPDATHETAVEVDAGA